MGVGGFFPEKESPMISSTNIKRSEMALRVPQVQQRTQRQKEPEPLFWEPHSGQQHTVPRPSWRCTSGLAWDDKRPKGQKPHSFVCLRPPLLGVLCSRELHLTSQSPMHISRVQASYPLSQTRKLKLCTVGRKQQRAEGQTQGFSTQAIYQPSSS